MFSLLNNCFVLFHSGQQLFLRASRLQRDGNGSFGFELDGHFISDIDPQGPAQKEGVLQIGDQLVEVSVGGRRRFTQSSYSNRRFLSFPSD